MAATTSRIWARFTRETDVAGRIGIGVVEQFLDVWDTVTVAIDSVPLHGVQCIRQRHVVFSLKTSRLKR